MGEKTAKLFLLSILILSLSSMTLAQQSQTGNLKGTVADEEGLLLPGVSVTIKSPAIVLPQMSTITNQKGLYRFPSLPPGVYEITFEMDAMNTLVRKDIIINVGNTATVNVTLQFKSLEETITVVGEAPIIDVQSTTKNISMDKTFIASVPSERNLARYIAMTPGASYESSWSRNSVHGSNVTENSYNLDGVNMTDPMVGTQLVEFSMDVMDELSIQTGGLAAEYGNVKGAVVNVVTKSGGNKFSGLASFYFNHENLQSHNTEGTPLEGEESGYKYVLEPSLALGGPVIKDKLWFFTTLGYNKKEQFVAGFPYGSDREIPVKFQTPLAFAKLTYQPNQKNRFVLSYNFHNFIQDNLYASPFTPEDGTVRGTEPTHVVNMYWTHFLSTNFFANLKAAFTNSKSGLNAYDLNTPPSFDLGTGVISRSSMQDNYLTQKLQVNADGTLFVDDLAGSHEFKFGAEFQHTYITQDSTLKPLSYNYFGFPYLLYVDSDINTKFKQPALFLFAQDTWTLGKRLTVNLGLRFGHQRGTFPPQNQDEGPITFLGVTFNRSVTESITPLKWTTWAPRLGLIYDITGDGKTLLKASYANYYSAGYSTYYHTANPNAYWYYMEFLLPDGTPTGYIVDAGFPIPVKTEYKNHSLKSPRTDEFTIGLERELFEDWSIGVRYIRKLDRNIFESIDANQLDIDELLDNGKLVWTNWDQVSATDPFDGSQQTFWNRRQFLPQDAYLLNPAGAERDYDGVEVMLNKRFSRGWSIMASYVWQHSRGLKGTGWGMHQASSLFENPNAHTNAIGRFSLDRRHQFKLHGIVKGPWGINMSGYFQFLSGSRYTRQIYSLDLGVPLNQGAEQIFAETQGSRGLSAISILDLRLEKVFRFGIYSIGVFVDGFNLFNDNNATFVQEISSSPALTFEEMLSIQDPRSIRLGFRFEF